MYGNKFWHRAPLLFIPASFLWAGLELLLDHFQIIQKLSEKYPYRKNFIKKANHAICCCIAYLITILIVFLIKKIAGINLLDYGVD